MKKNLSNTGLINPFQSQANDSGGRVLRNCNTITMQLIFQVNNSIISIRLSETTSVEGRHSKFQKPFERIKENDIKSRSLGLTVLLCVPIS